jgi:hypothetical protein
MPASTQPRPNGEHPGLRGRNVLLNRGKPNLNALARSNHVDRLSEIANQQAPLLVANGETLLRGVVEDGGTGADEASTISAEDLTLAIENHCRCPFVESLISGFDSSSLKEQFRFVKP